MIKTKFNLLRSTYASDCSFQQYVFLRKLQKEYHRNLFALVVTHFLTRLVQLKVCLLICKFHSHFNDHLLATFIELLSSLQVSQFNFYYILTNFQYP